MLWVEKVAFPPIAFNYRQLRLFSDISHGYNMINFYERDNDPDVPESLRGRLYLKADKALYLEDDTGQVTKLAGQGGGITQVDSEDTTSISIGGLGTFADPLTASLLISSITSNALGITTAGGGGVYVMDLSDAIADKLDKVQAGAQSVISPVGWSGKQDFNSGLLAGSGYFGPASPNIVFDAAATSYIIDTTGTNFSIDKTLSNGSGGLVSITETGLAGSEVHITSTDSGTNASLGADTTDGYGRVLLTAHTEGGATDSDASIEVKSGTATDKAEQIFTLDNALAGGVDAFNFIGSGLDIADASPDGSAITVPDNSWIRPQTAQQALYLTNGTDPSTQNSTLHLEDGVTRLSNGDGSFHLGAVNMTIDSVEVKRFVAGVGKDYLTLKDEEIQLRSSTGRGFFINTTEAHMTNTTSDVTLNTDGIRFNGLSGGYEFINVPDGTIVDTYGANASGKMVKGSATGDTSIWNNSSQCGVISGFAISQTANQVTIPVGQSQCVDRNSIAKQKDPIPFILENDVEFSIDVDYFPGMITSIYLVPGTTYGVAGRKFDILQTASFDNKARYEGKVFLGNAVTNGVDTIFTITAVPVLGYGIAATFDDLYSYIGILRRDVQFSMRPVGLSIDRQAGTLFNLYINYVNDHYDPNNMDIPLINDGSMVLVKTTPVNLTESSSLEVDMLQYWDGNALANVSNNDFTIQRFFLGGNGQAFVQYGEVVYNLFAQAEQALTSGDDAFTPNPVLKLRNNAHYMGAAIIKQGDTDFSNSVFKPSLAPFGEGISGISSSSTGDLQQAYNNSSLPQILTSLAFTLQSGTGDDADVVLQLNNNSGASVFSVAGNGNILAAGAGTFEGTQTFEVDAVFDAGATFGGVVEITPNGTNHDALALIQSATASAVNISTKGDGYANFTAKRADSTLRAVMQTNPFDSSGSNFSFVLYDSAGLNNNQVLTFRYGDAVNVNYLLKANDKIRQGEVTDTGEGIICESLKSEGDIKASAVTGAVITTISTKDGTWTPDEIKGSYEFFGSDVSGSGVGIHGFMRAVSVDTFGFATDLIWGSAGSGGADALETMRLDYLGNLSVSSNGTFGKSGVTSNLQIGALGPSVDDESGIKLEANSNGSVYFDSKLQAGGAVNFRYGVGAETGSSSTWLSVNDSGGVNFNNSVTADSLNVDGLNPAPSSATDTGTTGEIRYTADYIYTCVATNTWKRSPLTTW